MQTYTYVSKGKFELMEKPKPVLTEPQHLEKRFMRKVVD